MIIQTLPDAASAKIAAASLVLVALYIVGDKAWQHIKRYKEGQAAKRLKEQAAADKRIEEETSGARKSLEDWKEVAESKVALVATRDAEIEEWRHRFTRLELKTQEVADLNMMLQGELDKALRRIGELEENETHTSRPPARRR